MNTRRLSVIDWLRLFSIVFLFSLLIVLLIVMAIMPIHPDVPAFIDVPESSHAAKSPELEGDFRVSIRADGVIYIGTTAVNVTGLQRRLAEPRARLAPAVRLRVDRRTPFGHVRQVVKAAQAAGFSKLTFAVRSAPRFESETWSLVMPAPEPNPWPAIAIVIGCVAAAVASRFLLPSATSGPGCLGWLLLAIAVLALLYICEMYFPSCPPGMWC